MSKKGFTLVELLAVIAILAILAIIAMPNILDLFNGAKEDTFRDEVITIMNAAELAYTKDSIGGNLPGDGIFSSELSGNQKGSLSKYMDQKTGYKYCVKFVNGEMAKVVVTSDEYSISLPQGANTTVKKTDVKSATLGSKLDTISCN